ncbi:GNAT family N-acetyltransferase [Vibrio sp. 03_296]|uniref:GNAT family N-acetyltransferase n=1 Tax=Vibrio sp. 03_296 TaxID=2024409 RepID=UPI002D7E6EAA|nr:GNAT family N-acetyltransferase [Vibrio sp. 03_296]
MLDEQGVKFGYINLLYLLPEYRNKGLGSELERLYIRSVQKTSECAYAHLRYIPTNLQAVSFYHKHGWTAVGDIGERGQLAEKRLT